jgi:transposase-like protein/IS1 family transposase
LAGKGQVNCHCCNGETKKFGRFQNRNRIVQRYRCMRCGKTMSESQPLNGIRTDTGEAAKAINMLCEGVGIRAIARLTGLDQKTVLRILESAGEKCARLLDEKIRNVKGQWIQVDEVHGFVFSKAQNTKPEYVKRGDQFTYLSVDMSSKLIVNWRTAKRDGENTLAFLQELKNRMSGRFQLTTDAYAGYWCGAGGAVRQVFGNEIDYATEQKIFNTKPRIATPWYNPLVLLRIQRQKRCGKPEMKLATICHTERTNLSLRLFNRRFTRKTLGYSKKLENMRHAMAIFVAHFNFCRVHSAHGRTPARAAGITDHTWTIEEMLAENNYQRGGNSQLAKD